MSPSPLLEIDMPTDEDSPLPSVGFITERCDHLR
jgi:hypothetical protein